MKEKYYQTKESVDEYTKLAQGVNGAKLINQLRNYLPPKALVLELGSGPGTDWKILREYYRITGSDFSSEFLNRLIRQFPNEPFLRLNAISLNTNKQYQGIFSNKVLHHLSNTELKHSIYKQSEILLPQGIICHSFWKGTGTEFYQGLLVNYHSKADLKRLFNRYFSILHLRSYNEFEKDDSLLLIAKKR